MFKLLGSFVRLGLRGLLLLLIVLIVVGVIWKVFFDKGDPPAYIKEVDKQSNPFKVPKDSANVMWGRCIQYLTENRYVIGGGDLKVSEKELFIPYHNNSGDIYHRGPSVKVIRIDMGDSTAFVVAWWNRGQRWEYPEKKIIYYMLIGKDKYNQSFK